MNITTLGIDLAKNTFQLHGPAGAHGFLCALQTNPTMIMPSQWQPVLLGGAPEFKDFEEVQEVMGTILQLYNQLSQALRSQKKILNADKGYCVEPAKREAAKNGCHLAAIKKNNMKDKNKDLDRWHSEIRAPYERVFANARKRTRYCGVMKNQFAAFMEAIGFNLKRLVVLSPPGFILT